MSTATPAGSPAGTRAPGDAGAVHPPADRRPSCPALMLGHVPRRARPDDRRHLDPHHRRRPARAVSLQAWATTAYLITATIARRCTASSPTSTAAGRSSSTAISIFVVGSVLSRLRARRCTSSPRSAPSRASAPAACSRSRSTIIGDIVPPRERAKYQGYFLAVFGTSSVLGPVVGGFFAGQATILGITGWRWVFLVNVPIGIARARSSWRATCTCRTPAATTRSTGRAPSRWSSALVPLLIVAEQGRDWGWDSRPRGHLLRRSACVGIVAVPARRAARYGDDALLPLRLFRGRTFAIGSALNFIIGMGMFGGLAAAAALPADRQGRTRPTAAGLLLAAAGRSASWPARSSPARSSRAPAATASSRVIGIGAAGRRRCCCSRQVGADTPIVGGRR